MAVKLAKHLADHKKNVVLVLRGMTAPMLPCICPPSELDCEKSLGSILAAAHVSEPLIKHSLVTLKKQSYLTILGMLKGENEYTYPPYTEVQAQELMDGLREIAPFAVIDCGSYIANDILSEVAFKLPHSQELEEQYLAGNLLPDLSLKDSRGFRKEIEKIAKEVFGC